MKFLVTKVMSEAAIKRRPSVSWGWSQSASQTRVSSGNPTRFWSKTIWVATWARPRGKGGGAREQGSPLRRKRPGRWKVHKRDGSRVEPQRQSASQSATSLNMPGHIKKTTGSFMNDGSYLNS